MNGRSWPVLRHGNSRSCLLTILVVTAVVVVVVVNSGHLPYCGNSDISPGWL
jgi:hypothetical protein